MAIITVREYLSRYIDTISRQLTGEQIIISVDSGCICSHGDIQAIPYSRLNDYNGIANGMDINVL